MKIVFGIFFFSFVIKIFDSSWQLKENEGEKIVSLYTNLKCTVNGASNMPTAFPDVVVRTFQKVFPQYNTKLHRLWGSSSAALKITIISWSTLTQSGTTD